MTVAFKNPKNPNAILLLGESCSVTGEQLLGLRGGKSDKESYEGIRIKADKMNSDGSVMYLQVTVGSVRTAFDLSARSNGATITIGENDVFFVSLR